jgi:hypothetical protein
MPFEKYQKWKRSSAVWIFNWFGLPAKLGGTKLVMTNWATVEWIIQWVMPVNFREENVKKKWKIYKTPKFTLLSDMLMANYQNKRKQFGSSNTTCNHFREMATDHANYSA